MIILLGGMIIMISGMIIMLCGMNRMSNVKENLFHAIADFKQFVFANIYKEQFFYLQNLSR